MHLYTTIVWERSFTYWTYNGMFNGIFLCHHSENYWKLHIHDIRVILCHGQLDVTPKQRICFGPTTYSTKQYKTNLSKNYNKYKHKFKNHNQLSHWFTVRYLCTNTHCGWLEYLEVIKPWQIYIKFYNTMVVLIVLYKVKFKLRHS